MLCCLGVRLWTSFICDHTAWLILREIPRWDPVSWLVFQNLPLLVLSWDAVNSEGCKCPFHFSALVPDTKGSLNWICCKIYKWLQSY